MCIWFFIIYRMSTSVLMQLYDCCFFSSRRRHTICALVTGVQTCALPICARMRAFQAKGSLMNTDDSVRADRRRFLKGSALGAAAIPLLGVGAARANGADAALPPSILALEPVAPHAVPITDAEREGRLRKAQRLMAEHKMDAVFMGGGSSLEYFTG